MAILYIKMVLLSTSFPTLFFQKSTDTQERQGHFLYLYEYILRERPVKLTWLDLFLSTYLCVRFVKTQSFLLLFAATLDHGTKPLHLPKRTEGPRRRTRLS